MYYRTVDGGVNRWCTLAHQASANVEGCWESSGYVPGRYCEIFGPANDWVYLNFGYS